jgi:daunorubicin resistance ABC transporter ATP-binding subunit
MTRRLGLETSSDEAIVVGGLGKRFGAVAALNGLELSVRHGTVVGLLGPNGAGKTTAIRILTTILRPDVGSATVLGLDVVHDAEALRPLIGLAGQYAAVDENLNARENLRLIGELCHQPRAVIRPRIDELIERFGMSDVGNRPLRTFSGGMRRRIDLAAALVHRPPVLFLDEPTTGLDPSGRRELWAIIQELVSDGTTVLLTTQYLEEADRLSDHILVIDHGKVIAQGSSSELKQRLGATILELRLPNARGALAAAASLRPIGGAEVMPDGHTVAVTLADQGGQVLRALRLLDANGLIPRSVEIRQPTLDDVFLQLTGDDGPDESRPVERFEESSARTNSAGGQPA